MKKGDWFAFKDHDGKYKKVEYYRDAELIDSLTGQSTLLVEYIIHSPAHEMYNRDSVKLEFFIRNSRLLSRETHCWKCKTPIDEIANKICHLCGGITCPIDNVCMCGFIKETNNKKYSQKYDEFF